MHRRYMVADGFTYHVGPAAVDQYRPGSLIILRDDQVAAHRQEWKLAPCAWVRVTCACGHVWHTLNLQPEAELCPHCKAMGTHQIAPAPLYLPTLAGAGEIQPPDARSGAETGQPATPKPGPVAAPKPGKPKPRGHR